MILLWEALPKFGFFALYLLFEWNRLLEIANFMTVCSLSELTSNNKRIDVVLKYEMTNGLTFYWCVQNDYIRHTLTTGIHRGHSDAALRSYCFIFFYTFGFR